MTCLAEKRLYLAGPMSGIENFNYPAFNAEAARLRALGYHVENPAENPEQGSWLAYMRQAIAQLVTCDAVVLLTGWEGSKGATAEFVLAHNLGLPVRAAEWIQEGPRNA